MDKKKEILEFTKYMFKRTLIEPVKLVFTVFRKLLYPKSWFYAIFAVFVYRLLVIRNVSDVTDRYFVWAMIILLLWKEYTEWYDDWKYEQRQDVKKRAREQTVEFMKGK